MVRLGGELVTIRTETETIQNLKTQVVNLEGKVNTCKGFEKIVENNKKEEESRLQWRRGLMG